jgi:hypothetical protein
MVPQVGDASIFFFSFTSSVMALDEPHLVQLVGDLET